jgi:hypothetical protein
MDQKFSGFGEAVRSPVSNRLSGMLEKKCPKKEPEDVLLFMKPPLHGSARTSRQLKRNCTILVIRARQAFGEQAAEAHDPDAAEGSGVPARRENEQAGFRPHLNCGIYPAFPFQRKSSWLSKARAGANSWRSKLF